MRKTLSLSLLVLASTRIPAFAGVARFQVRHDHGLRSCRGELLFRDDGVEYVTSEKKHARVWKYLDIQQLGLLGARTVSVVTYEDQKLQLGRDRIFRFELVAESLPSSLWTVLQTRLSKPLVSALVPQLPSAKYQIPAKHQHALGGCQGDLEIGEHEAIYRTSHPSDSRIWRYQDLTSIGSTGPFQLRITSMERTNGEHGAEKNFIFDLKRRLDPEAYDFLWRKVHAANARLQ